MVMIGNLPSFGFGFVAGFGAGFFTREIVKAGRKSFEPVFKAAVKNTMVAIERGRESVAHLGETFEDLVAEARTELGMQSPLAATGPGSEKDKKSPSRKAPVRKAATKAAAKRAKPAKATPDKKADEVES
jgi:uncharacterized membrane protein